MDRSSEVYDRISELPDGIIEDILSRLTLTEALCTGVLSRRWKDMWTYTTGSLDFDFLLNNFMKQHKNLRYADGDVYDIVGKERDIYVNRVNKVLKVQKGSGVEEFGVKFCLESTHKSDIDSWIDFAVCKGVKKLKLILEPFHLFPLNSRGFYQFPAVKMLCLKSLNLKFVNVSDEVFKFFLMTENCPFLEIVSVMFSQSLVDVRIVAPCLKLKHLKIQRCHSLKYLDIYSAPNLTTFLFWGREETRICLREVPNLTDVKLAEGFCEAVVTQNFNQLSVPLSRIEKLHLCVRRTALPQIHEFPILKNLRQLELNFSACENILFFCSSMIKSCPNLNKFSIILDWSIINNDDQQVQHCQDGSIHKNLKVVEIGWFCGETCDVELATYLLSTSPFLDKIVADTRSHWPLGIPFGNPNDNAKDCITSLARRLSPKAQLVLL